MAEIAARDSLRELLPLLLKRGQLVLQIAGCLFHVGQLGLSTWLALLTSLIFDDKDLGDSLCQLLSVSWVVPDDAHVKNIGVRYQRRVHRAANRVGGNRKLELLDDNIAECAAAQ